MFNGDWSSGLGRLSPGFPGLAVIMPSIITSAQSTITWIMRERPATSSCMPTGMEMNSRMLMSPRGAMNSTVHGGTRKTSNERLRLKNNAAAMVMALGARVGVV